MSVGSATELTSRPLILQLGKQAQRRGGSHRSLRSVGRLVHCPDERLRRVTGLIRPRRGVPGVRLPLPQAATRPPHF